MQGSTILQGSPGMTSSSMIQGSNMMQGSTILQGSMMPGSNVGMASPGHQQFQSQIIHQPTPPTFRHQREKPEDAAIHITVRYVKTPL